MEQKKNEAMNIHSGFASPLGCTMCADSLNFAIHINDAVEVYLMLDDYSLPHDNIHKIQLDFQKNKTGSVWHIRINGLNAPCLYYYLVKKNGQDELLKLFDPYANTIKSHPTYGELNDNGSKYVAKGVAHCPDFFDWQDDTSPQIPLEKLIIYEMHVRGFSQDKSSNSDHPGTFKALAEKVDYFKELGINAVELLPIYEFNECENLLKNPDTNEHLCNYFGYSTVSFFAPMLRYSSTPDDPINAIKEFKDMVKILHKNGIEVILDVVYNHTFEGNEKGPVDSYKGLDKKAYYMIDEQDNFLNFSGCGNTFNCNNPITAALILESLKYWVSQMHVDGFRFDLATILARSSNGTPLTNAPLVEAISQEPVLANTKLIAEAWDAGGLYQVGGFYPGDRWAEWNGRYRDIVRRFIKGTANLKKEFATAIAGSQDLYGWRGTPLCSVNFITAHDGFSLADLVTFNEKKNLANGEENRDGFDFNDSWNCGFEGHSENKKIIFLRDRQIRNFMVALFTSQGVPMLCMGDEYAHTRHGNNNTWCQDNELNWFLWDKTDRRPGFHRFVKLLIKLKQSTDLFSQKTFLDDKAVEWHSLKPNEPAWDTDDRVLGFSLNGPEGSPKYFVIFNASQNVVSVQLPNLPSGAYWRWVVNTFNPAPQDFFAEEERKKIETKAVRLPSHTSYILETVETAEEVFPQQYQKPTDQSVS